MLTMPRIRLTDYQKAKLERVKRLLEALRSRKLTQGEAIEALVEFAERNREYLVRSNPRGDELRGDPLFDMSIVFDIGPTDARTHDRVLYRRE